MRVAGIDIGTLTCRLLVAAVSPEAEGPVHTIRSERKILRLGEGVDRTGRLKPEAMSRVIETIREWKTIIESHGVERYTAVATSAVREAGNREEFLDRVRRETGIAVEVIDGEEEARRTFLGIRSGLPDVREILGLDIGGGSTEFIASRPGQPLKMTSIDMGVVRLTERVLQSDPAACRGNSQSGSLDPGPHQRCSTGDRRHHGTDPCRHCRHDHLVGGYRPKAPHL